MNVNNENGLTHGSIAREKHTKAQWTPYASWISRLIDGVLRRAICILEFAIAEFIAPMRNKLSQLRRLHENQKPEYSFWFADCEMCHKFGNAANSHRALDVNGHEDKATANADAHKHKDGLLRNMVRKLLVFLCDFIDLQIRSVKVERRERRRHEGTEYIFPYGALRTVTQTSA